MLALLASGCGLNLASPDAGTPTVFIITLTLPPTTPHPPTEAAQPATAVPTLTTIEGITSTKINVRGEPSTAGATLGMIDPFAKVQVIGKDPSGNWYQIIFAQASNGKGWVTAQYVEVKNKDAVPVIGAAPTPTSEAGGGEVVSAGTPTSIPAAVAPTLVAALQDNDSQQAPAVNISFSPTGARSIIYSSDVSAPTGDAEDWIQFTPYNANVSVSLTCAGNGALSVELWQNNAPLPNWEGLSCGESKILNLNAGQSYLMRLIAHSASGGLEYVDYSLTIGAAR